nr:probable LRR receptor-like serine/threonine-protein kinase At1g34110 [Ipomoea batatas]
MLREGLGIDNRERGRAMRSCGGGGPGGRRKAEDELEVAAEMGGDRKLERRRWEETDTLQANGSVGCEEEERRALLILKDAFNGTTALSSWGDNEEEKDCCMWEMVNCD